MSEFKHIFLNLRNEKKYNQEEMAKELGVSKSTIAMWETGKRLPSPELYEQIADYFNVDIDFLYGRTNIRKKYHYDTQGNEYVITENSNNDQLYKRLLAYHSALSKLSEKQQDKIFSIIDDLTDFELDKNKDSSNNDSSE